MPQYKVGDKCIVLPPTHNDARSFLEVQSVIGSVVTLKEYIGYDSPTHGLIYKNWWVVEEHPNISFSESILEKLDPPKREDLSLGSWDLCPWQPLTVKTTDWAMEDMK
jgi:hypothetical protein